MASAVLVERDVSDGELLLRRLDAAGFPVRAAFWSYSPETESWALVIASSLVRERGPAVAYDRLIDVMRGTRKGTLELTSDRIELAKDTDPRVVSLSQAVSMNDKARPIRLTNGMFNNLYVHDLLILRLRPGPEPGQPTHRPLGARRTKRSLAR